MMRERNCRKEVNIKIQEELLLIRDFDRVVIAIVKRDQLNNLTVLKQKKAKEYMKKVKKKTATGNSRLLE